MKKQSRDQSPGKRVRKPRAVVSKRALDRLAGYPAEVLVAVCRHFLSGLLKVEDIAKVVTAAHPGYDISRQQVYLAMRVAMEKHWVRLTPPGHESLQEQLSSRFDRGSGALCVAADEPGLTPTEQVANRGATLAFDAILASAKKQKEVHIGLGGGLTMFKICQILNRELGARSGLPHITFHALTSGFTSSRPQYSPNGLLNLFASLRNVSLEALMAPPLVNTKGYQNSIRQWDGLAKAFAHRAEMDLILSSVGSAEDPDDELRRALEPARPKKADRNERRMLGDILSLPYGMHGPLPPEQFAKRTVTLFQLEELRGFVRDRENGKKRPITILFASPCSFCGLPKTSALRPLLRDNLRVWQKLVIDTTTAEQLLRPEVARE